MLRGPAQRHNVVIVHFCDENGSELLHSALFARVRCVLERGFELCGSFFRLLCFSASQLRSQRAYFVAEVDPDELRRSLVPASVMTGPAYSYASRLGLFCTADRFVLEYPLSQVRVLVDQESDSGHLYTDGAGWISEDLRDRICEELGLKGEGEGERARPSVFQIRYGAFKGVLSTNPSVRGIAVFQSMQKMDLSELSVTRSALHNALCVVSYAKYSPVYLNRESITLLCSLALSTRQRWDPFDYLMELQHKELRDAVALLRDQAAAKARILAADAGFSEAVLDAVNLSTEPFWASLLKCAYLQKVKKLRSKTRLPQAQQSRGGIESGRARADESGGRLRGGDEQRGAGQGGAPAPRLERPQSARGSGPPRHRARQGTVLRGRLPQDGHSCQGAEGGVDHRLLSGLHGEAEEDLVHV
jgi:hypothetical protein